jgi:hypothetical protein
MTGVITPAGSCQAGLIRQSVPPARTPNELYMHLNADKRAASGVTRRKPSRCDRCHYQARTTTTNLREKAHRTIETPQTTANYNNSSVLGPVVATLRWWVVRSEGVLWPVQRSIGRAKSPKPVSEG